MSNTRIFLHGEGSAVRIRDTEKVNPTIGLVSIDGLISEVGTNDIPVVILEIEAKFSTSQNFTRSLKDVTYVLPFGDRPSEISVSCMIYTVPCDGEQDSGSNIKAVMEYYKDRRIKRETVSPVEIVYAGQRINGFITGMTIGAASKVGSMAVVFANFNILGWFPDEN